MDKTLAADTQARARRRCEYCRLPQAESELPFSIDHIKARKHQGTTTLDNLALACTFCNLHKGPNIGGSDPVTGQFCRLFNPRNDRLADHFRWDGLKIRGITSIGRVTVEVLVMNAEEQLAARRILLRSGWFLRIDI
jgi:hypothetical protein